MISLQTEKKRRGRTRLEREGGRDAEKDSLDRRTPQSRRKGSDVDLLAVSHDLEGGVGGVHFPEAPKNRGTREAMTVSEKLIGVHERQRETHLGIVQPVRSWTSPKTLPPLMAERAKDERVEE